MISERLQLGGYPARAATRDPWAALRAGAAEHAGVPRSFAARVWRGHTRARLLRPGDRDVFEDQGGSAHRRIGKGIISDGDELLPELEVISGEIHLAERLGDDSVTNAEPDHAQREVARAAVGVAA